MAETVMTKCRLCRRTMRPRTMSRKDPTDPTRCANCAILNRAFGGANPPTTKWLNKHATKSLSSLLKF